MATTNKSLQGAKSQKSEGMILVARPEFRNVPEAQKQHLASLIDLIPSIRFFRPDGNPNKKWKMFYGDTWEHAHNAAQADKSAEKSMLVKLMRGYAAFREEYDSGYTPIWERAFQAKRGVYQDAATREQEWYGVTIKALKLAINAAGQNMPKDIMATDTYHFGFVPFLPVDSSTFAYTNGALRLELLEVFRDVAMLPMLPEFKSKEKLISSAIARMEVWQKGYILSRISITGKLYASAKMSEDRSDISVNLRK
jgi:hypothetical protein